MIYSKYYLVGCLTHNETLYYYKNLKYEYTINAKNAVIFDSLAAAQEFIKKVKIDAPEDILEDEICIVTSTIEIHKEIKKSAEQRILTL